MEKFEIEFNPCAILSPIFNTKQLEEWYHKYGKKNTSVPKQSPKTTNDVVIIIAKFCYLHIFLLFILLSTFFFQICFDFDKINKYNFQTKKNPFWGWGGGCYSRLCRWNKLEWTIFRIWLFHTKIIRPRDIILIQICTHNKKWIRWFSINMRKQIAQW